MKKIQSKIKALECKQAYSSIFQHSRAANSEVSGGIPPKSELIQAFIVVLVTCNNEKDPIKNTGSIMLTRSPPHNKYGNFFKRSRAANSAVCGQIGPKFELIQDYIVALVTCKNEEDPIKNHSTRELTSL